MKNLDIRPQLIQLREHALSVLRASNDTVVRPDGIEMPYGLIRLAWVTLAIGIATMLIWSWAAPLSGAVVAEGVVKNDGNRKTIQHQEGGIVKTIHVKDGDHVRAGQVLVTLDDVRVGAGLEASLVEQEAGEARAARLSAERDLATTPSFPESLTKKQGMPRIKEILQKETALFQARRHALDEQITLLRRQIGETGQEMTALEAAVRSTRDSHQFSEAEYKANEKLKERGFISEMRLMEIRRNQTDYRAKFEIQQTELAKAKQKKTELELKIASLKSDYAKQAADELKDVTSKLYKLAEDIRPQQDAQQRQEIVAPVAGEVVDLKFHSQGAVIGPREPILDIVPNDALLIVEARVKPENITEVHAQGAADVRLTAYKQRSTPVLEGRVIYVGADRLTDKATNQPYYTANVEVPAAALAKASRLAEQTIALTPGMQAEVFIKTQERSAFDYFFEPITQGLRRAMRER